MSVLPVTKEERRLRQHLKDLTITVTSFLDALDREMAQPSTNERGQRIARLANDLNMANDNARFFGLNIDFRTGKKRRIT